MEIRILGSRGEIEETSEGVKKHSGVLIDGVLFDIGEKEYLDLKPKAIFISHLHPDHAYFVREKETPDFRGIKVYGPESSYGIQKLKKGVPVEVNGLKVTPIPTTHSKKVKSTAYLIESNKKKVLYTSDMIWINKKYHDLIRDCDLVITEASSFDRDLVRRDKKTGEIYGHSSVKKLYDLFSKLGAKKILFTHFGSWFLKEKEAESKLKGLGDNVIIGRDNLKMELQLEPVHVEPVTPKVFPTPQVGLILVKPHGKLIWEGKKTAIVKSVEFKEHIGEPMYLIEDNVCYGIITLHEPVPIDKKEFKQLYDRHRVSEEERQEWARREKSWAKFPLFLYDFDFEPFEEPRPIRLKVKGPQVFVKAEHIQFLSEGEMSEEELEYFHSLCHSNLVDYGDPWCRLHFRIASEIRGRGLPHLYRSICDRPLELEELIKEATRDWVNQYIKNLKKYTKAQVGDDFRIVLGWYSSLKRGKKLFKHTKEGDIPITEEDCKKLAVAIVKELIDRGATFNRPETYKEYARELFEYVVKEIGEDKIPWKDQEMAREIMEPSDITLEYLLKLSDKELEELWKWLHEKWKREFPDGRIPEDYQNANIMIQIERFKRGLIDESYEDKDKLDEVSRFAWEEYSWPKLEEEPEEITLQEVVEAFRSSGVIPIKGQPYAAYIIGRIVNEGRIPKDHDIDILFRQRPDPRLVISLKKALPEWLAKRIHPVFDIAGPGIGLSLPIYGYALNPLPEELMKIGFGPFRLEQLKTGRYIVGVKPKSGWFKYEFFDTREAWEKWGADHLPCVVEEKVDGRRHQIHIMPDNTVKLITEDTQRDRASLFPEIVEELKSLNIPDSILDGEIVAFNFPPNIQAKNARAKREVGELVPREDTAAITAAKTLSPEFRSKLVLVIYDIMKLKGEDLVDKPYRERREIYSKLIKPTLKFLDTVRGEVAETKEEFFRLVEKYRRATGSEGVVLKDVNFKYPVKYKGENRSEDMCKIKNLKEIDVLVLGIKQKKERKTGRPLPVYMYESYIAIPPEKAKEWLPEHLKEYNNKVYAYIGLTYGTKVKAKIGDIITVMPIRIRFYEKNGKKVVTWMFPLFKEVKKDKKEPDPLSVAEKLAKLGTAPAPPKQKLEETPLEGILELLDEEPIIKIELVTCPFYTSFELCPLRKRYGIRRAVQNLALIEEEILKYPIMCPLASRFKCPYLKDYYYTFRTIKYYPELTSEDDYGEFIEYSNLPKYILHKLQGKYMDMPKGEFDWVMESHILTSQFVPGEKKLPKTGSQHIDFRIALNGALEGWSIVGGSVEKMITPKLLLERKGKGFRAEQKALQPKVWLFKEKKVDEIFDVMVGAGEPRGKMFVMTRGKGIHGAKKLDLKEYFLKSTESGQYGGFEDWTRLIVVPVRVQRVDPETKQPIKGKYETLWRAMIPKEQMPYTISDRAMKKNWRPPKNNPEPFPVEWVKKNWPEQYEKWKKWMASQKKELSEIKYTLSMHSWRGPVHVRGMYIRQYYLFLDDKGSGSVRTFKLDDNPIFASQIPAWDEGRDSRKYLDFEGPTKPMSRFNPNKAITGEMKILEKGSVSYEVEKNDTEKIHLNFKGKILKGEWILEQHSKGSDRYFFYKKETGLSSRVYEFVYHKHMVGSKDNFHYDIRIKKDNFLDEFNLYGDISELKPGEAVEAYRKTCYDPEKWFLKEGTEVYRPIGPLQTWITVIDYGKATVLEENPQFISMVLDSKKFEEAYFVAKKEDGRWTFERDIIRGLSSTGDPVSGDYFKPFQVKEKTTWDYFNVYIYDPREFTRTEPVEKVKKYLPELEIPEGVTVYIGLYPVPGEIHNARVMMVRFKKDKWSYEEAFKWIKKNKLHIWKSKMIREV